MVKKTALKVTVKYDRVIGIDLGNGLVKIRSVYRDGRLYELTLPSAFGKLTDVGSSVGGEELDLDTYRINGIDYVWGEDITRLRDKMKPCYGHQGRYESEAYKIMAQIAMSRVVKDLGIDATEKVLVVTGVPSIETDTECETDIANAFYGESSGFFETVVNGQEYSYRLAHVQVTAQALATVIGRYIDEVGRVLNSDYEKIKVAVVDIGAGTTDLDAVFELRRQSNYHSIQRGFRDVYEDIRTYIRKYYPAQIVTDYDILEIIEEVGGKLREQELDVSNSKKKKEDIRYEYRASKRSTPVDFTDIFINSLYELAMDIQQAILDKWKNTLEFDEVLIVGGSAEHFSDMMLKIVKDAIIPENNGDSNVEGYYRLGVSIALAG
ncbi:hypothetical protein ACQKIY_25040 [Bacillus mycoides]|uniref:ParM/StbA family protein n=1 Tax=Bacillus mycoides TaxID=1405 RepID=UPI003D08E674